MDKEKILEKEIILKRIKFWDEKLIDLSWKNNLITYGDAKPISITPSKDVVDKLLEVLSVRIDEIIDLYVSKYFKLNLLVTSTVSNSQFEIVSNKKRIWTTLSMRWGLKFRARRFQLLI